MVVPLITIDLSLKESILFSINERSIVIRGTTISYKIVVMQRELVITLHSCHFVTNGRSSYNNRPFINRKKYTFFFESVFRSKRENFLLFRNLLTFQKHSVEEFYLS